MSGCDRKGRWRLGRRATNFNLMGGNSVKLGDRPQPTAGPVLHLKLFSFMGGNNVRRGLKRRTRR